MVHLRAWRRRQRSHVLFVSVPVPGSTIVASGLRLSQRLRMIEVSRCSL